MEDDLVSSKTYNNHSHQYGFKGKFKCFQEDIKAEERQKQ